MRPQSVTIKVNRKEIELHVGDSIWFNTKDSDMINGGIIEQFYRNSFKIKNNDGYYEENDLIDIGFND